MMRQMIVWSTVLLGLMGTWALPAYALKEARPIATDGRIKVVMYNPNEVYKFIGHYGFQSSIEFAADEEIRTISVGDSLAWLITPSGSRIFLKPIEQEALTNMTVITDKRIYQFELHPSETTDLSDPNMTFVLRFQYSDEQGGIVNNFRDPVPNPEESETPEQFNFKYTMTGPESAAPLKIFDDGEFTYFQFRNKNANVPAFFLVDASGDETLINYRVRGDYIVVERVASRFTLRFGNDVVCVFNETMPLSGGKPKSGWWPF